MRRLVIALFVLALLAGACTSTDEGANSGSTTATSAPEDAADPGSGGEPGSSSVPGTDLDDGEVPPIPILTTAEAIVEPGDTVAISADPLLAGTVTMIGPAGDVATAFLDAGTASLTVPIDVAAGTYQLELAGNDSAFGVIGVSDGPGVWATAPEFVLPGEAPEVLVTTYGIPPEMVAALEVTTGDGVSERLVPHPMLNLAPLTVATTEGIPDGSSRWSLPAGFAGRVRVVAGSPSQLDIIFGDEGDPPHTSTERTIRLCDAPGVIAGDLGGPGVVRATWIAGEVESASVVVEDGSFTLEVRPGTVLVSAFLDEAETAASPMVLRVKCGETVDIGAGAVPVDTGPAPGSFLGGLTLDDLFVFSAESAGELTIGSAGLADCSMADGVLQVSIDPESSTEPYLYWLEVERFDGTGRFDGTFAVTDIFTDETSEGTVAVDVELANIEGIDAVGGAFSGDIAGALGDGSFDVEFTCALFGGLQVMAPRAPSAPQAVNAARLLADQDSEEVCRTGMAVTKADGADSQVAGSARAIMAGLIARLEGGLKKLSWSSQGDVTQLLAAEAQQQLVSDSEDASIMAAVRATMEFDFLMVVEVWRSSTDLWSADIRILALEGGRLRTIAVSADADTSAASERLIIKKALNRWREFKRALKEAGICGKTNKPQASAAKGGTDQLEYAVTDLEGEPVDGATVDKLASTCGSFTPETGRTVKHRAAPGNPSPAVEALNRGTGGAVVRRLAGGGTFTTTLTGEVAGCTDEVTFVARAPGPSGEITTERDKDESTVQIAIPMFEFKVTIDIAEGSGTLHSESTGQFFVEPDFNQIIGAGGGTTEWKTDFPCIVISESGVDERTQLFTGDGRYQVMPVGELASGSVESSGTVRFIPRGYLSNVTVSYSDPDCFPEGTSTNDPFGTAVFSIFSLYPHIFSGEPQGFEVAFNADGSRTSETWQLIESPGTVTIEVWGVQAGADSN